jgi:hypothetical protein
MVIAYMLQIIKEGFEHEYIDSSLQNFFLTDFI